MSKVVIAGDASGTGTFTISAPNGNTDRTLVLPDEAGTVLTSASPTVLPKGGPAFYVSYSGSDVVLTNATWTKVILNNRSGDYYDTDNCFDTTSNYRFTPTVAGYYKFDANIQMNWSGSQYGDLRLALYKNGAFFTGSRRDQNPSVVVYGKQTVFGLIPLNGTTDYIELYVYTSGGSGVNYQSNIAGARVTNMTGFLARAL